MTLGMNEWTKEGLYASEPGNQAATPICPSLSPLNSCSEKTSTDL